MPPFLLMAIWAVLHLIAAGLAAWRGGWPERTAIGAAIVAWIVSLFVSDQHHWLQPQYALLCVDAGLLAALGFVALRSSYLWALAAAGFQLGAVLLHLTSVLNARGEAGSGRGLLAASFIFSLFVFAAIFVGVIKAARRRAPQSAPV